MIRASILGATGYSGGELIKYLHNHPAVKIQHVTSESSAGKPVTSVHAGLSAPSRLRFEKLNVKKIAKDSDVVFSCFPSGVGIKPNQAFLKAGAVVIDLSGDFRLPTAKAYKQWYKLTHPAPALLKKAVYGLPELFRSKVKNASLIANPGCYPTAALLSLAPLVKPLIIDPKTVVVDSKSGISGAGKKVSSQFIFSELNENVKAYGVTAHRHQPEIETYSGVKLTFTPHLIPMSRGILSALYATLKKKTSLREIRQKFHAMYGEESFVRLLPEGEFPQTKSVTSTNYCDIGIALDKRLNRVVVIAAIDNLGKGAASQAVQNMNIRFNQPETQGII